MTSPQSQQSHPSRGAAGAARRRQRSTRLVVAVGLLVVAAVLVTAALATSSHLVTALAAVGAVVLGAAATKITHSELVATRVEAARDRAAQARDYAALTEQRTAENRAFAQDMKRKIAAREEVITGLENALGSAQRQVAEQRLKLNAEARRADLAERSLSSSEDRAAEAIVLVAELEAELDVARSELATLTAELAALKSARRSA